MQFASPLADKGLRLVFVDRNTSLKACPEQETAKYRLSNEGADKEDMIRDLMSSKNVGPTKYTVKDYEFKAPRTNLQSSFFKESDNSGSGQELEMYHYSVYLYATSNVEKDDIDRRASMRYEMIVEKE
jgi:uncharacterized protein involved in type VI secretion and phage assembly